MSKPLFFVRRGDRLVARLKHLFYAWRFAKQVDGRVIMHWSDELPEYWQQFDGTMYSASLIFDLQEFYAKGGAESLVFMGERIGTASRRWEGEALTDPAYAPFRFNKFPRDIFRKPGLVFYESQAMRYQLEDERKTPEQISAELGALFKELPPTPYIQRVIDQVRTKLGDAPYVGLHVRRGDVYDRLRGELPGLVDGSTSVERVQYLLSHYVSRTSPQALYEPAILRALSESKKIAYFSDSPTSIDGFRKRFGGSNIIDMSKFKTRMPIQKAYFDFVMLSQSEQIVSTRSNYASFGAQLSGAEHVIVSAVGVAEQGGDDLVEVYYETAIREFLSKVHLSREQAAIIRGGITAAFARTRVVAPSAAQEEASAELEPEPEPIPDTGAAGASDDGRPKAIPARLGWSARSDRASGHA